MLKHPYIIIMALALVGCSSADQPQVPGNQQPTADNEISFAPAAISRATSAFQDTYTLFKVYTYKHTTSDTQTVMPGYNVKHDGTSWIYTHDTDTDLQGQLLKYWDLSAQSYDFCAYAPNTTTTGVKIDGDPDCGVTISGINAHTAVAPPEYLVAKLSRHIADSQGLVDIDALTGDSYPTQPLQPTATVPLAFHHLISQVELRIYNTGTHDANIESISVRFSDDKPFGYQGTFEGDHWGSFTATTTNLYSQLFHDFVLTPIDASEASTKATKLATTYEYSQAIDTTLNISITVNGQVLVGSYTLSEPWLFDKNYIYYIHIAANDQDPILISLDIDDFVQGDIITPDSPLTDW